MRLPTIFWGCLLMAGLPGNTKAEPAPATASFRLSEKELQETTAVLDETLRVIWHESYVKEADNLRGAKLAQPIPPEEISRAEASDEEFIRRATLDATDVIPTAEEVRAYLDDTAPNKRHRLVDRLLSSPRRAEARFNRLASLLRLSDEVGGVPQAAYIELIRTAARTDVSFDEIVHALLTASGSVMTNPATGFLLRDQGNLIQTTTEISWSFLRKDMDCAVCHDHPFSEATEQNFYDFASGLGSTKVLWQRASAPVGVQVEVWPQNAYRHARANVNPKRGLLTLVDVPEFGLCLPSDWGYQIGKPNQLLNQATPLYLDAKDVPLKWSQPKGVREEMAQWLIHHERFAQATALREWTDLFGVPPRTFQERNWDGAPLLPEGKADDQPNPLASCCVNYGWNSTDDLDDNDPKSAGQKFIKPLGDLMQRLHFDLREFQRVLMHTRAYSRVADAPSKLGDSRFHFPLAPRLRPMSPEQLWNSLILLGGTDDAQWRFAGDLHQTLADTHPLRIMGRGPRVRSEDSRNDITFDLVRLMMTGEPVHHATQASGSVVKRLEKQWQDSSAHQVESLFLAILGRMPSEEERARALGVASQPNGLGDVAWSLLNTGEFLFRR